MNFFSFLPDELIIEILSELKTNELFKISTVCKQWCELICYKQQTSFSFDVVGHSKESDSETDEWSHPSSMLFEEKKQYFVCKRRARKYFQPFFNLINLKQEKDELWVCRACDNPITLEQTKRGYTGLAFVIDVKSSLMTAHFNGGNKPTLEQNNLQYVGEIKEGYFDGYGLMKCNESEDYYIGFWKMGHQHGHGFFSWARGLSYYDGECKRGLRHGKGEYVWSDGRRYIGEHKQNYLWGQGTYFWSGGQITGSWKCDNTNGICHMLLTNGTEFVGKYVFGKRNGKGAYTWPDGSKYKGHYKNGNRHGQGKMEFSSGVIYQGAFVDDERHGFGKLTWPNGDFFEGHWVRGRRLGVGYFYKRTNNQNFEKEQQTWDEDITVSYANGAQTHPL